MPLVDFGGWGVDLDGQISYLGLGPVLIFGEGLMQDLDRLPAEPVLRLPPLAITKSLCGRLFEKHFLIGDIVCHFAACCGLLKVVAKIGCTGGSGSGSGSGSSIGSGSLDVYGLECVHHSATIA